MNQPPIATGGRAVNEAIAELAQRDQWAVWQANGRPYTPGGTPVAVTKPFYRSGFDECWRAAYVDGTAGGLSFILLPRDPYLVFDLDDVLAEDGTLHHPEARELVRTLNTYTEISPSGRGLRIVGKADRSPEPGGCGRKAGWAEAYFQGKALRMTGKTLPGAPERIKWLSLRTVEQVWAGLFPPRKPGRSNGFAGDDGEWPDWEVVTAAWSLEQLPEALREKFKAALAADAKLRARWEGGTEGLNDTTGSARDLSLAHYLRRHGFTLDEYASVAWIWDHGKAEPDARHYARCWAKVAPAEPRKPEAAAAVAKPAAVDVEALATRAKADAGAAFEPEVLDFLAALQARDPAAYERVRARLKKARVRVGELDAEIARRRQPLADGEAIRKQGRALEFPEIEPWPEPVDGAELLDALAAHLQRFAIMPSDHTVTATVLWPVHAHALDAATHTPRLLITSPVPECGKSQIMEWLAAVVPKPHDVIDPTGPTLFRPIEAHQPTVLIDEGDLVSWDERRDVRMVINAGHNRNSPGVPRCVGEDLEPRVFRVWAPLAFAMIGKPLYTQLSRSIVIEMRRMAPDQHPEHRRTDRDQGFGELRRKCARWAADHLEELRAADPEVPVTGRKANCWRPLLAIADLAGGEWPTRARGAALALSVTDEDAETIGVQLLASVRLAFGTATQISTENLLRHLHAMTEAPWGEYGRQRKPMSPRQLATLLKPFGITSGTLREGETTYKGYRRDQFGQSWARYLSPSVTPSQPMESATFDGFSSVTPADDVTDRKEQKAKETAACDAVTDRTSPF
jgi:hypothetical protein